MPRIAFVNKMDRVGADFANVVEMMRDRLGANAYPVMFPLGEGELYTGHVDLVTMCDVVYDEDSLGVKWTEGEIPRSLQAKAEELRHELLEAAAEHDEELLEKYLEGEELTEDEFRRAIRKATLAGAIDPVLCGAAFKNKGVQRCSTR